MEDNEVREVPAATLAETRALRVLRLARNRLRAPPTAALAHTPRLQAL